MTAQAPDPACFLLRLYPAPYRAAHGQEIAAVHEEATADLTGLTLLREHASLAAHALRLRTRLSSTHPAGRVFAGAAPFALAGATGVALLSALFMAATAITGADPGTHQNVGPAFLALAVNELPIAPLFTRAGAVATAQDADRAG
ncbi:hypothetical protein [Streptacidiphilus sp. EB129]|uniref:hypothetical protein n=1 Tax=Streptacidiphilus sp. EB129 TaxID=3156262 RepID=UPI0035167F23